MNLNWLMSLIENFIENLRTNFRNFETSVIL